AMHQGQPAGEAFGQGAAAFDRIGVAVDAEHAAIGGFKNRAAVAAAAERAVDIVLAVLRREQAQHLGEHHRNMDAAHAPPSFAASNLALRRAMLSASTAA